MLDAGIPDPDLRLRKRLIEALVQQNKAAEVEAAFAALGDRADSDVELLCQHAQSARDSGDMRRAREFLDKAVTKFPEEPLPYLRRARLSMLSPNLTNDALADLGTAIKLRPNFWQAYRSRARCTFAPTRP